MLKTPSVTIQGLLQQARQLEPWMLQQLAALVRMESPSHDKLAVDRAQAEVAQWAKGLGGKIKLHRHKRFGDSLEARFGEARFGVRRRGPEPVLLLGHVDTVWDKGTIRSMPWRLNGDRIHGPGVLDMKAGIVMILAAIRILAEVQALARPVIMLLHGDEEVGSPESRKLTETIARQCRAVYVLEPAQGEAGAYKTARKGVGQYRLEVRGTAAHSGIDFFGGHNALLELAYQIQAVSKITDPAREITVSPGLGGGGTRVNVVPAQAWVEMDVRIARAKDEARVERALRRLHPHDEACSLHLTGGLNRPPMERTRATVALFRRAQEFARQIGITLAEASTGGGSDGNFTSALGVPTLDGMGAVGAGAHAIDEHCLRTQLAPRTALLAAMLL